MSLQFSLWRLAIVLAVWRRSYTRSATMLFHIHAAWGTRRFGVDCRRLDSCDIFDQEAEIVFGLVR